MAGEIGHVVYGARVLTFLGDAVSTSSYWNGTLFPDIRHLGVVSRHHTHPDNVTRDSLIGADDFMTGLRVHAWIDSTREIFFNAQHIKELLPWHPFVPHVLKLYEDVQLYARYDDWDRIQRPLNAIDDGERSFVHDDEAIARWHSMLQDYFKSLPTDESRLALSRAIGLSENSAQEINVVFKMLAEHEQTHNLMEGFWRHLEELLQ